MLVLFKILLIYKKFISMKTVSEEYQYTAVIQIQRRFYWCVYILFKRPVHRKEHLCPHLVHIQAELWFIAANTVAEPTSVGESAIFTQLSLHLCSKEVPSSSQMPPLVAAAGSQQSTAVPHCLKLWPGASLNLLFSPLIELAPFMLAACKLLDIPSLPLLALPDAPHQEDQFCALIEFSVLVMFWSCLDDLHRD